MSTRNLEVRLPLSFGHGTRLARTLRPTAEAQRAAMIRDGRAQEDDGFIILLPLRAED
jgi:hypothetical protein